MEISPISSIDSASKAKTNIEGDLNRELQKHQDQPKNLNSHGPTQKSADEKSTPIMVEHLDREDLEELKGAINVLNDVVKIFNEKVAFDIHEDSGRMFVKVLDSQTDKVIRTIPPEEILNLSAKIQNVVGLILDTTG